jgi:hypothetical protein
MDVTATQTRLELSHTRMALRKVGGVNIAKTLDNPTSYGENFPQKLSKCVSADNKLQTNTSGFHIRHSTLLYKGPLHVIVGYQIANGILGISWLLGQTRKKCLICKCFRYSAKRVELNMETKQKCRMYPSLPEIIYS